MSDERSLPLRALVLVTVGLFGLRLAAARTVGFGDSEALYASYALHPAAAYLDHPGLVGAVASLLGGGSAPTPQRAHGATIILASVVPWLFFAAARAAGATKGRAAGAALVAATVPELAIGLFALSPDTLLAPLWLASLTCALLAVKRKPDEVVTQILWSAAGILAGVAATAKVTGLLLLIGYVGALLSPALAPHRRRAWPWAGLALGALVFWPVAAHEARAHYPMLTHRLIDSQAGAGFSLRHVATFLGGQLAYVGPLAVALAGLAAWRLAQRRGAGRDGVDTLLLATSLTAALVLAALSLWSGVAEPHWFAPALLALPIAAAREGGERATKPRGPRWLVPGSVGLGLAMTLLVHAWVLLPDAFAFARPRDARHDIANELFGWDEAERTLRELAMEQPGSDLVVVAPHWTLCAQLHARLRRDFRVGCDSPLKDDFDGWLPRGVWRKAEQVLLVTDTRYPIDVAKAFPDRRVSRLARANIYRGGRQVRTFTLTLLSRGAHAAR